MEIPAAAVLVSVVSGIGSGARWYRTCFLEEAGQDYVRTARARASQSTSCSTTSPNALIPILTGIVVLDPVAVHGQPADQPSSASRGWAVICWTPSGPGFCHCARHGFIGSILYIIGLILTDISYTWADPGTAQLMG